LEVKPGASIRGNTSSSSVFLGCCC